VRIDRGGIGNEGEFSTDCGMTVPDIEEVGSG
jgi:hypothetical protein